MSGRCLHNAQQRATAPPRRRPRQSLRLHFIPALRETRYVFSLCCQRTQARCLTDHTSARHNLGVAFPQLAHALHELDIDVAAHPSDLDRRWRPRAARPHPVRLLSQTPAAGKRICDLWPRVAHADAEPQELQLAPSCASSTSECASSNPFSTPSSRRARCRSSAACWRRGSRALWSVRRRVLMGDSHNDSHSDKQLPRVSKR